MHKQASSSARFRSLACILNVSKCGRHALSSSQVCARGSACAVWSRTTLASVLAGVHMVDLIRGAGGPHHMGDCRDNTVVGLAHHPVREDATIAGNHIERVVTCTAEEQTDGQMRRGTLRPGATQHEGAVFAAQSARAVCVYVDLGCRYTRSCQERGGARCIGDEHSGRMCMCAYICCLLHCSCCCLPGVALTSLHARWCRRLRADVCTRALEATCVSVCAASRSRSSHLSQPT